MIDSSNLNVSRIAEGLSQGKRFDMRDVDEFRDIKIELGVSKKAEGSAKVRIGKTEVWVGVKLDLAEPYPDSPDKGNLIVTAELLPMSHGKYEYGPPKFEAVEIGRLVDRGIRESKYIQLDKLCIKEGEKVWNIFIDVYSINDDGNLLDAGALGAIAALKTTLLPKYDEDEEKVLHKELTKTKLPVQKIPVLTTFGKLSGNLFVDATMREEKEVDARLSIATIEDGTASAMQKGGSGPLTAEEVIELTEKAVELGKKLRKLIPSK